MSAFSRFTAGFRALFNRAQEQRDLEDEVRHYIEQATAANQAKGMSAIEARRAARASIGSESAVQADARAWGWNVGAESLMQDARYAMRFLVKSPGFTLAAACSLAFGIGANTAIFSLIEATLVRRLPVLRSSELVTVASPGGSGVFSYPAFDDVRRANTTLSGLAAFGGIQVSLSEGDATDLVSGVIVTGNYFNVLGLEPAAGRLLTSDDDRQPGAHPVAVISSALWERRFAKRADIAGREVRLNGQPFTIVGVAPKGFHGIQQGNVRDLFVPMMMQAWMRPPRAGYSGEKNPDLLTVRDNNWLFAFGRLEPGVSIEQSTAALTAVVRGMKDWPDTSAVQLARLDDGPPGQRERLVSVARLLGGVVLVVLVIACANVANLLLLRATARRKEIAVRLALGATRGRLVRQLLAESVLLSLLGGSLGLAMAWVAIRAVRASPPPPGALPVTLDFTLDPSVLLFTFTLSVITGIVFGLVPALHASRPDLVPALKDQAAASGHGRWNARKLLVVVQVGLSLVLLVSAGLFIRSLERTRAIEPGIDVDRMLTAPLNIQLLRYTSDQGKRFYRDVVNEVNAIPGVESSTIVRWVPLVGGGSSGSLHIEGRSSSAREFFSEGAGIDQSDLDVVSNDIVGLDFFKTMGIALKRGRDFLESDTEGTPLVAVVNETFARTHFGSENPLGRRISLRGPEGPWTEIVGVSADSKYATLDEPATRIVYLPSRQHYVNGMILVVRAKGDPATITNAVGTAVQSLDRSLPVAGVTTMRDAIGTTLYVARAGALLLTGFGALALLLSAVGLYGVLAYAVSRRTREFGLRMALGAQRRVVMTQVLGEGVTLVLLGVVGGLVVALWVTRLLGRFLYETSTTDPGTYIGTPLLLVAVAIVACLLPAWRAMKVDPIRALKEE